MVVELGGDLATELVQAHGVGGGQADVVASGPRARELGQPLRQRGSRIARALAHVGDAGGAEQLDDPRIVGRDRARVGHGGCAGGQIAGAAGPVADRDCVGDQ